MPHGHLAGIVERAEAAPKKPFKPSPYQASIFAFVKDGRGSAIVEAVAGSGKSTTIKQALLRIPEDQHVQVFAFNTIIAREMKEGVAELGRYEGRPFAHVRVSTFHSVGYSAILRRLKDKGISAQQVKVDSHKVRNILEGIIDETQYELYGSFCAKLVGLAKGQGFGAIQAAYLDDWMALIHHHDLFLDSDEASEELAVDFARRALKQSNLDANKGSLDFDDQLYIPLLWKLRLWQNDWVFIDEAQDTNPVRRAIAKLTLRPGGRLIAVGDRHQAIYGFTGASHDALDLIKADFNCAELPLTVSYRCAQAIVRMAQTLVSHIEAHDEAPEGKVSHLTLKETLAALKPTDAIMCRNTAPLIELAFKLVGQGVGCRVLGREIGQNLVGMVKRQKAKGLQNLLDKLEAYRDREVAKHTAAGEEGKAEAVNDRVDCIKVIAGHLNENERTVPALCVKIESLFSDGDSKVLTLATLHKLKGAEFESVALYRPELCPSKWARQEWQQEQEKNLLYVGYTRAKLHLIFVVGE